MTSVWAAALTSWAQADTLHVAGRAQEVAGRGSSPGSLAIAVPQLCQQRDGRSDRCRGSQWAPPGWEEASQGRERRAALVHHCEHDPSGVSAFGMAGVRASLGGTYRAASAPAAPASCSRPQPPANPRRGGVIRAAMLGGQRPVRAEWVGARTHRIAEHVQHEEPGRGGRRGGGRRGRLLAAEARGPFAGAAAGGHRLAVVVSAVEGGGRRWHAVEGGWFGECRRQGQDGSVTREGCAIANMVTYRSTGTGPCT